MPADIGDEIPEALRELPTTQATTRPNWVKIGAIAGGAGALLAMVAGMIVSVTIRPITMRPVSEPAGQGATPLIATPSTPSVAAGRTPTATPAADGTLLGHYPYTEAPPQELEAIVADGSIKLRRAAAEQYKAMAAAAAAEGITLVPISGFRSLDDQQYLFFDVKAKRGQDPSKRAEVSAPPGYSEHHTGYAIDIGDANVPAADLNPTFENTAAFQWLQKNAAYYSFEISFPRNNPQGVSYEPWHWRFVGDIHSLETFYKARSPQQR